jgi:LEA14-like dessication related protein
MALAACSLVAPKFTRPAVTVSSVEMRGGNLLSQNFAVKLHIENPNDRPLPVTGLHVELNVGGDPIATGVSDRPFVVPALGKTDFDMSIKANLALALLKLADKINQRADSIDYEVTGGARIDLPFLRELPFRQSGSLPLQGLASY